MRLRRRLGLVAAAYVALMAVGGVSALIAARVRADHSATGRAFTVGVEQAGEMRAAYLDMEAGQRGFVLTGDPAFLEPFDNAHRSVAALEASLRVLVSGDRMLEGDLASVSSLGARWLAESADPSIVARKASTGVPPGSAVASGKELLDDLRSRFAQLDRDLGERRDRADRGRERAARLLVLLVLSAPIVAILVTAIASRLVDRWILHPIDAMGQALERIRRGDLSATVPVLGPPDVAELGRSADGMRRMISAQRDEAIHAREGMEQNAILAISVRNELAADIGQLPVGWTGAASMLPAEGIVAGDCYDVVLLSPTKLAVVVIDIAGHGGGPAIAALRCKEILRAALRARMSPGDAIAHLAGQVGDLDESFLTTFVAVVDTLSGECHYANAGHPPALFHHNNVLEELMPTGPLVGPFPGVWKTEARTIDPGGQLAIYTDGLTEARNADRVFYGMERLTAQVLAVPCEDAQHVIDVCFADLKTFSPQRLVDDVTMVIICRDCPDVDVEV